MDDAHTRRGGGLEVQERGRVTIQVGHVEQHIAAHCQCGRRRRTPKLDCRRRSAFGPAEGLEREPQAKRHHARFLCRLARPAVDKLRLAKGTAAKVSIDAVKVWMVSEVLGLRAEAEVHGFCQLKSLMQTEIHIDKSRPMENISPQCSKPLEQGSRLWISRHNKH